MLARLGFSIVASLNPEVILIDEILAVGDAEFQKKCLDRMMAFKNKGVTMILVSHSKESVELICDKAIWIDNHTLYSMGEAREIMEAYGRALLERLKLVGRFTYNRKEKHDLGGLRLILK